MHEASLLASLYIYIYRLQDFHGIIKAIAVSTHAFKAVNPAGQVDASNYASSTYISVPHKTTSFNYGTSPPDPDPAFFCVWDTHVFPELYAPGYEILAKPKEQYNINTCIFKGTIS